MSGDEIFVTLVAIAGTMVFILRWVWLFSTVATFGRKRNHRGWLSCTPYISAAILWFILKSYSASDVRDDNRYMFMYTLMGLTWVWFGLLLFALGGLSVRDDVIERNNRAAALALNGVMIGTSLAFAGGNIGDGPGWWVVVFSSGLASLALWLSWMVAARISHWADHITIDRDDGAGLRAAGFLIALGLIYGRGAAGNWHSAGETINDFLQIAWLGFLLVLAAALIERFSFRLSVSKPVTSQSATGFIVALLYVAWGLVSLAIVGSWQ